MTLRLTIGIDPGKKGAVAALADGVPVAVLDMPIAADGEVDGRALAASLRGILQQHTGAAVLVVHEKINGFSGDRGARVIPLGQADGIARGVVAALGLPAIRVHPQTWKSHFGLRKKPGGPEIGKDASRTLVVSLFPNAALPYLRAKDDGRAEALLLALWAEATEAAA
jgi:hypothetical protein